MRPPPPTHAPQLFFGRSNLFDDGGWIREIQRIFVCFMSTPKGSSNTYLSKTGFHPNIIKNAKAFEKSFNISCFL